MSASDTQGGHYKPTNYLIIIRSVVDNEHNISKSWNKHVGNR